MSAARSPQPAARSRRGGGRTAPPPALGKGLRDVLPAAMNARNASAGSAILRDTFDARLLRVGPDIQLAAAPASAQARVATPAEAIRANATHIVRGRSVTQAADPGAAFPTACDQVGAAARHPHFC